MFVTCKRFCYLSSPFLPDKVHKKFCFWKRDFFFQKKCTKKTIKTFSKLARYWLDEQCFDQSELFHLFQQYLFSYVRSLGFFSKFNLPDFELGRSHVNFFDTSLTIYCQHITPQIWYLYINIQWQFMKREF